MDIARNSYVRLFYDGKNITRDLAPFLTQFTFTDNASGKSDDISFSLQDREGLFISSWFPEKGSRIKANIISIDGQNATALPCGEFEIDQIDFSAPPRTLTVKALSVAISKNLRHENHNKIWENTSLQTIASVIASDNGLRLYFDGNNIQFERKVQANQPDIEFLQGLCSDAGLNLKIRDFAIVIYDDEKNSQRQSVTTINSDDKNLINWRFSSKGVLIYKSARVTYHDHIKNKTITGEYSDDSEGNGGCLEISQRVDDEQAARALAEKKLNNMNLKEVTGSITLKGDVNLMAGNNITVSGFGIYDGKYTIDKAVHTLSSGYTTSLSLVMGKAAKAQTRKKKSQRNEQAAKVKRAKVQVPVKPPELNYKNIRYYGDD